MRQIPAATWVAIIPTRFEWVSAPEDNKPKARFYFVSCSTFIEGLLRPETAKLLDGVQEFDSLGEVLEHGRDGFGMELTTNGEVTYDGRHPELYNPKHYSSRPPNAEAP